MKFPITVFLTIYVQLSQGICQENYTAQIRNQEDSTILIDSALLYIDAKRCIHAIAFNTDGQLFVAGCQDVYKITKDKKLEHFATLKDTTDNTMIWGMSFDKKGNLFLAAKDRITKITSNGNQITLIKEDFGGPSGVSDVRLDRGGNLYIVYDNIVAKYDSSLQKSILVDGNKLDPPIQWSVGIEFDNNEDYLYVSDCNGKNLFIIPMGDQNFQKNIKVIPTNWGQYLTKDKKGNIFLTMFGPADHPEFLMFTGNRNKYSIYCNKRPYQNRKIHKKAIAFNSTKEDSENGIYCIIGNKIYLYPLPENRGK